jgi:hypothetical protein
MSDSDSFRTIVGTQSPTMERCTASPVPWLDGRDHGPDLKPDGAELLIV